ncbi:hypothetical protein F5Y16DRAFT_160919 [Xylariaceae sp. FL0255]|nr:hypothetical protein F5Y16DRAFT_160919 [Xylariaceae sp. FL0255]
MSVRKVCAWGRLFALSLFDLNRQALWQVRACEGPCNGAAFAHCPLFYGIFNVIFYLPLSYLISPHGIVSGRRAPQRCMASIRAKSVIIPLTLYLLRPTTLIVHHYQALL